ncbi:MAG: ImmA/IrrE family metallo-endopeptidase [Aquimonas sp.]|nr:ImmA/IrrE family metallo-endopeptidase [Aquimonas sp.]
MLTNPTRSNDQFDGIEAFVTELQRDTWRRAKRLGERLEDPLTLLNPRNALEQRGFQVCTVDTLGTMQHYGRVVEVAGELNRHSSVVAVSRKFERPVQLFTLAHELGHVVLKHQSDGGILHRDRPLSGPSEQRTPMEREADWFGACWLMPAKHVIDQFHKRFRADPFVLTDETSFHLYRTSYLAVRRRLRSDRDLSLALVTAQDYGGRPIEPMYKYFGVSPMAVAFRIEQLFLVDGIK